MKKTVVRLFISIILISILFYKFLCVYDANPSATETATTDLSVLNNLEQYPASTIENEIRYLNEEKLRQQELNRIEQEKLKNFEYFLQKISLGELTYRQVFSETLFVGDSLINAMLTYKVLDASNIIGAVSANFSHLEENVENIKNLNPKNIVLHYGINMAGNLEHDLESFIKKYSELIIILKNNLPETKIYISGIFNVSALNRSRFPYIPVYNEKLQEMCLACGVNFIDNSSFLGDNEEYYGTDGIHAKKEFYNDLWLPHVANSLFYA